MADPLGLIGSQGSGGLSPLNPAGGARKAGEGAGGPNFKDVMLENLKQVNDLQRDATHAIEDLQTGQRDLDTPKLLQQHYRHSDMGVYADVLSGGTIEPGAEVRLVG